MGNLKNAVFIYYVINTHNVFPYFIRNDPPFLEIYLFNSLNLFYFHAGITLYAAHPLVECIAHACHYNL